jgi:ankyrin repeat protein
MVSSHNSSFIMTNLPTGGNAANMQSPRNNVSRSSRATVDKNTKQEHSFSDLLEFGRKNNLGDPSPRSTDLDELNKSFVFFSELEAASTSNSDVQVSASSILSPSSPLLPGGSSFDGISRVSPERWVPFSPSLMIPNDTLDLSDHAFLGNLDGVTALLRTSVVDALDHRGYTALMKAASRGHLSIVETLLEAAADPDCKDPNGYTALFWATIGGHDAVVRFLLDAGASATVASHAGLTPMAVAAWAGHANIVRMLIAAGASPDETVNGRTPLMAAAFEGREEVVKLLVEDFGVQYGPHEDTAGVGMLPDSFLPASPMALANKGGHKSLASYFQKLFQRTRSRTTSLGKDEKPPLPIHLPGNELNSSNNAVSNGPPTGGTTTDLSIRLHSLTGESALSSSGKCSFRARCRCSVFSSC